MAARCGSTEPDHYAKSCHGCQKVYRDRQKAGLPRLRNYARADSPTCVCGLTVGNSAGIPVHRYPLTRHIRGIGNRSIGYIELCDDCLPRYGVLKELFVPVLRTVERDDGLRAYDSMPVRAAS